MAVSQLQDIWVISKALQHPVLTRQHFGVLLVSFGSRRRHLYQKRTKNTFSYVVDFVWKKIIFMSSDRP